MFKKYLCAFAIVIAVLFGGQSGRAAEITSLELTISCAASGKAVDWINTASLDCGDGERYDALAVQQSATTLSAYFRSVPPGQSCQVSVGSGFDSKVVGTVRTAGSVKQRLSAKCAW